MSPQINANKRKCFFENCNLISAIPHVSGLIRLHIPVSRTKAIGDDAQKHICVYLRSFADLILLASARTRPCMIIVMFNQGRFNSQAGEQFMVMIGFAIAGGE